MESPQNKSGWTGMEPPRTVERKRRGRGVDVIGALPTPPHSRQSSWLPTPESIRQPRKSSTTTQDTSSKLQQQPQQISQSFLPTPQTLPRKRKSPESHQRSSIIIKSYSPEEGDAGHTTFMYSDSHVPTGTGERIRRRPGLTFAQQMGLLSTNTGNTKEGSNVVTNGFGGRLGVGIGMGGVKNMGHKAPDLLTFNASLDKDSSVEEENPFLVRNEDDTGRKSSSGFFNSPGKVMMNRRKSLEEDDDEFEGNDEDAEGEDEDMAGPSSPLANKSPHLHSPSKSIPKQPNFLLSHSKDTLKTPSTPPASTSSKSLPTLPSLSTSPTPQARKTMTAKQKAMMDEDNNPFLAKAGDIHKPKPNTSLGGIEGLEGLEGMTESERPFVTYVFRGTKKIFANPFVYGSDRRFPKSELNVEDDDFEDHPCPKPKLLWPTRTPSPPPVIPSTVPTVSKRSMEITATPSPPSSPIMKTPQTQSTLKNGKKRNFLSADKSLEGFEVPTEVYTDSEEERERSNIGGSSSSRRRENKDKKRVKIESSLQDDEEEEEEVRPVRRGLLFGVSSSKGQDGEESAGRTGRVLRY